jgi:four helix bundle protein
MALIRSFRDLDVYNMARQQSGVIFKLSRSFPAEERFALTSQIRSAARAVCAMIAEAWGRRRYEAAFSSKLNEAIGEAMETQAWLDQALDCAYISQKQFSELDAVWQHIGGKLNRMIDRSSDFCPQITKRP